MHAPTVARIAGWIVEGRYAPGSTLPTEPELGATLGVSRTVVREAIRALQAKGMVTTRPRVGTRVTDTADWHMFDPEVVGWTLRGPIDSAIVEDLVDMRLAIEPFAAGLAASRREASDLTALEAAFERMAAAVDDPDGDQLYTRADLDFHRVLLSASHNRFVIQALPMVEGLLKLSFELSTANMDEARLSLPDHRGVLDAVAARDSGRARARMEAIIVAARADILLHIAEARAGQGGRA